MKNIFKTVFWTAKDAREDVAQRKIDRYPFASREEVQKGITWACRREETKDSITNLTEEDKIYWESMGYEIRDYNGIYLKMTHKYYISW